MTTETLEWKTAKERLLRVNHAGEYGAKRIYQGQLATLKDAEARKLVQHMAEQEQVHLDYFDDAIKAERVRPTALMPIWHVGGFLLGAVTAKMGTEAAMACTVAVESVIDEHYREQLPQAQAHAPDLSAKIEQFRQEEMEHHDTGLAHGAEQAPAYKALSAAIRGITKTAIFLSKSI